MIDALLGRMSLEQKIGQCLVFGMSGTTITNDVREAITRYQVSGLRLSPFVKMFRYFSDEEARRTSVDDPDYRPSMRKIAKPGLPPHLSPAEYCALLNELKGLAAARSPALPLHLVIDQEGDVSKDLARGGVPQFPSQMGLAASREPERMVYEAALATARILKASGIDMIHSPVVDINLNPRNPEIGVRAFGDDPELVARLALAALRGYKEGGVIAAAKHFPGRGDSATDAHHDTPVLDVDLERLREVELLPYRRLIEAGLDSIMVGHCFYPAVDDKLSTVSRKLITGLLRDELGFEGLITTDSMTMGALVKLYGVGESCARALEAGADLVLMKAENEWRGETFHTIKTWVLEGRIDVAELDAKVRRILAKKLEFGLFTNMGKVDPEGADRPYGDKAVLELSRKAAREAVMVVKDEQHLLPLDRAKRILLINQQNSIKTPNDSHDHPGLFSEYLESRLPGLLTYEVDFASNATDETEVPRFVEEHHFDLIICTNWYDRSSPPLRFPKLLADRGYPVILLTNTPYLIRETGGLLPGAKTSVLDLNLTPEGLRTLAEVLLGDLEPEGVWPLENLTKNPIENI